MVGMRLNPFQIRWADKGLRYVRHYMTPELWARIDDGVFTEPPPDDILPQRHAQDICPSVEGASSIACLRFPLASPSRGLPHELGPRNTPRASGAPPAPAQISLLPPINTMHGSMIRSRPSQHRRQSPAARPPRRWDAPGEKSR